MVNGKFFSFMAKQDEKNALMAKSATLKHTESQLFKMLIAIIFII